MGEPAPISPAAISPDPVVAVVAQKIEPVVQQSTTPTPKVEARAAHLALPAEKIEPVRTSNTLVLECGTLLIERPC